MTASRLRQRVAQVRRQIDRQVQTLLEHAPFIRGGVYRLRRRCGKSGCRCTRGQLHESWVFMCSQNGAQRLVSVPSDQVVRWRPLAQHYRRFRRARAELVRQFRNLLRLIGELEAARTVSPPPRQVRRDR